MSVTVVAQPQTLQPGYNPSIWYFNSTNNWKPGFRYFAEVQGVGPLAGIVLGTYRLAPALTTGYGVLDLTRLVKNFVSSDYLNTGVHLTPNSWMGYVIKVYEEYSIPFVYTNFTNPSGNLTALYDATNTMTFLPGDQINIAQNDNGVLNPVLQGIHTVIAPTDPTIDPNTVYIDVPWDTLSSGTVGGSAIYADNRKTVVGTPPTAGPVYIFNGAVPFLDYPNWDASNYKMTSPSNRPMFLTSMPRKTFSVYETQDVRLNFANYFTGTSKVIYFTNDTGDILSVTTGTSVAAQAVIGANVGPTANPTTVVAGTIPLIKPTTKYYNVSVYDNAGHRLSEEITFNIDRRCKIQDFEILFMDRMGSLNSFAFELRGDVTNNNTKSTFKKLVGGYGIIGGGSGYTYNSYDTGEQVSNVNFNQTQQLNTNWMNDDMSLYFQELVTSPVTYLKVGTNTYVPIVVTNTNMVEKRQIDKRLVRYTIDVKFSNNANINI